MKRHFYNKSAAISAISVIGNKILYLDRQQLGILICEENSLDVSEIDFSNLLGAEEKILKVK